jgi:hypothetical protein
VRYCRGATDELKEEEEEELPRKRAWKRKRKRKNRPKRSLRTRRWLEKGRRRLILTSSLTYMAKPLRQAVGPIYAIFLDGDVAVSHHGDKHTA